MFLHLINLYQSTPLDDQWNFLNVILTKVGNVWLNHALSTLFMSHIPQKLLLHKNLLKPVQFGSYDFNYKVGLLFYIYISRNNEQHHFSAAGSDLNPEQDSLDGQMPSGRSMLVTIEPSSRHSPPSGEYIFNVPFKCTNGVTSDPSNLHCTLRLGTEPRTNFTLICS